MLNACPLDLASFPQLCKKLQSQAPCFRIIYSVTTATESPEGFPWIDARGLPTWE